MVGYRFSTSDLELRIEHDRCIAVTIALESSCFRVVCGTGSWWLCDQDRAARQALASFEATRRGPIARLPGFLIAGRLLELRERCLATVNPTAASVLSAVLAMSRTAPRLAGSEALYAERFVIRDVLQHRAAAAALGFLEERLWGSFARTLAPAGDLEPVLPDDATLVAAMARWRDLYSPDGRAYRSLNRTLMNLPDGIRGDLLCNLSLVYLERPVTTRLALASLLLHAGDRRGARHPETAAAQRHVLQHASDQQIAAACRRIGLLLERELRPTRLRDLATVVRYLIDCPEPHRGDLPGLVERAVRWHRRIAEAAQRRLPGEDAPAPPPPRREPSPRGPRSERTARPPIPLPDVPGIRFLASVAEVVAEGEHMGHCIADYAEDALDGQCYLFHVSYAGEEASVEVDRRGTVGQACGPHNARNQASVWGAGQLRTWGGRLRAARARRREAERNARCDAGLEERLVARLAQADLWSEPEPDEVA